MFNVGIREERSMNILPALLLGRSCTAPSARCHQPPFTSLGALDMPLSSMLCTTVTEERPACLKLSFSNFFPHTHVAHIEEIALS